MRNAKLPYLASLASRFLINFLFSGGAVQKDVSPADAMALLSAHDLSPAWVWPALIFNGAAGLMLLVGLRVRYVAAALAGYCGATISVENWAIAGGCLALAVAGSGRMALQPA